MENEIEALEICQIINFIEDDTIFGCLEPIKYKVIFEGMGIELASCQHHYEFMRSEVEKNKMSAMIKFIEINNDNPKYSQKSLQNIKQTTTK
ncbi:MAG: hypothetical protein H0W58_08210 [Acidobacteria bacterium]|jgi:hypothetical protein|nr:hypothetical protein [Acidobacteriota bacterium]